MDSSFIKGNITNILNAAVKVQFMTKEAPFAVLHGVLFCRRDSPVIHATTSITILERTFVVIRRPFYPEHTVPSVVVVAMLCLTQNIIGVVVHIM